MKSIIELIKDLEKIADKDECDGDCDLLVPYKMCEECKATRLLNEIGELLR